MRNGMAYHAVSVTGAKTMIDKLDAALRFSQDALNLRATRQQVISANIANADTPGYKARDFDFASTLSATVSREASSAHGVTLATTSPRHIAGGSSVPGLTDEDLKYRNPTQSSIDGNTVEMDTERVKFADNGVHYESSLTVISAQIKTMLAAVAP
jgi:flagellar basal-body rod protein FlgB